MEMSMSMSLRDRSSVPMGAILHGKYTVQEDTVLGGGVSSTVLAATQKASGRKVAIKVVKKLYVHDWEALQREEEIMQRIRCMFTVNLLDHLQDEAYVYFVMERAEGGELLDYMKKYGLEEMPKLAPWFIGEVVLALQYLHDHGIIHRDVKPENILLTGDFHVKLADFGSAIWTEDGATASLSGTPPYTDPLVLQGKPATAASDWWSLGCVLYHMFTGQAPYNGRTAAQVLQSVHKEPLQFGPYIPEEVKDLVTRLLTVDRNKRLGVGPYGSWEIRSHPFFTKADVAWDNILLHNNCTLYNRNYSRDVPNKYKRKGEKILLATIVLKDPGPRALTKKAQLRQLILTSYPRLFYLDPVDSQLKGAVTWDRSLYAECAPEADVFLVNVSNRTYRFCVEGDDDLAKLWVDRINRMVKK
eukprot:TRINITY_DN903_c0_g1_i1.p1 TRINITY_DN903_c0_g1~~TRINITY_DN903_c0_g1_i1.p1  ORF type:complete len:482 (-),score=21.38 TRINITY_DN903_c0_g1_i1:318-1562(-)